MIKEVKEIIKSEEKFDKDFSSQLKDSSTQKLYLILVALIKIVASVTFMVNFNTLLTLGIKGILP